MNLYQASMSLRVLRKYHELFNELLNILISLAYNKPERKGFLIDFRHMIKCLIADSGAWSVAKGTIFMIIDEVISHLQVCGHLYDFYFNYDTDFSNRGFANNIANQFKMENAGLHPVPVVHNFFDGEIPYYIGARKYDWLALGSSQSTNFDDIRYAVDRIKSWGNPDIRIHWFGGSKFEWLCKLPIASCDTTSWVKTGAYGFVMYWNPEDPDFDKAHRIYVGGYIKGSEDKSYHWVTYPWRKELEEYLYSTFGLTYTDLLGYDDKFHMQLVNTRFYVELEKRINDERVKNGVPLE